MQVTKEKKPMYARKEHSRRFYQLIIGKTIFLIGVLLLSIAIVYMLINFEDAGSVREVWFHCLMAGVTLVFLSMLFTDLHESHKS